MRDARSPHTASSHALSSSPGAWGKSATAGDDTEDDDDSADDGEAKKKRLRCPVQARRACCFPRHTVAS
jgi:hypothetical protein